jgi:hypothetical protein
MEDPASVEYITPLQQECSSREEFPKGSPRC